MKTTYTITLPDGTKATRKSDRQYTHVVAIFHRKWDGPAKKYTENCSWTVVGYSSSQSLAEKSTSRYKKWFGVQEIAVFPIAA